MSCWRISCRINRDIKVLFIFQLSDLGSHVVTPACSFLTVAAGKRSATPASASTDMLAAPRSVISARITFCDLESTSVSEEQGFMEVFFFFFQVRCGRRPCLLPKAPPSPPDSNAVPSCPGGHECVEHPFLICFSPPCHQWGVCSTPDPPTPLQTQCEPNSGYLDNSCARITLIFKKDKVPQVRRNNINDISYYFSIFWHIHKTINGDLTFINKPPCLSTSAGSLPVSK